MKNEEATLCFGDWLDSRAGERTLLPGHVREGGLQGVPSVMVC